MTDKVQKIREEIEKRYEYWKEKEFNSHSIESEIRMSECQHLLLIINSLQDEPCNYCQGHNNKEECDALVFGHNCPIVKKPVSEDLEEAAIAYNKKAVTAHNKRVNFVVVGNVPNEHFIAGAKWKENHLWKPADGDDLPEIDKEVIVLTQPYPNDEHLRVVFAHRTNKYTKVWNSDLGEEQVVEIERYNKGGWNIPDVKWWLNCGWPNKEE
jgi:hypothetical protein